MSRTGPKNPHRSGLRREPRRFEGPEAERRTGGRGYNDVKVIGPGGACWCGELHPGGLHWGPLPSDTSQAIGIEPGPNFKAPTMVLDLLPEEKA